MKVALPAPFTRSIALLVGRFRNRVSVNVEHGFEKDSVDLVAQIEEAKREWLHARSFFDAVTDPDLIDYAIYSMQAAERRYVYMLKLLKEQQIENVS
jgi:KaiC/GvpD/RAD55 family RecA-like ATPase